MRDITMVDRVLSNMFPPCEVTCEHCCDDRCDILSMKDTTTGSVVLEVGTDYSDSYYPFFVADFTPENMASNVGR